MNKEKKRSLIVSVGNSGGSFIRRACVFGGVFNQDSDHRQY